MNNYKENIRYIAHFVVEADTPMAIGSGEKGLTVDRLIARDANGLPYIPGTSLAGVVRHEIDMLLEEDIVNDIFGYQGNGNDGAGSRISFSSAVLVSGDGKQQALEGLNNLDFTKGYYSYFNRLPERDHVRITHKGSADTEGHGKFDEELVHKGTRFVFEIELQGEEKDKENWKKILNIIHQPSFRIGAGTRKGFGGLKIVGCKVQTINLNDSIEEYLSISGSLNKDISKWDSFKPTMEDSKFYHYQISIKPESFYLFGAGIGDEDVDMAPKTEKFFDWSNNKPNLSDEKILIPGTSIKGALSHRFSYYYNKLTGVTIDSNSPEFEKVDKDKIISSINRLKELEEDVKTLSDISNYESGKSIDLEDLEKQKTELELKKEEINKLVNDLTVLKDDNSLVEDSHYWNKYKQDLEDQKKQFSSFEPNVSELNEGVRKLFGYAKSTKQSSNNSENGLRGRVIISDVYLDMKQANVKKKIFDHVAIDRFTGGGIEGALYQEKAVSSKGFIMDVFVEKTAFENETIKSAFEFSLDDLTKGNLQLGGNTGKGHGVFVGSYKLLNEF